MPQIINQGEQVARIIDRKEDTSEDLEPEKETRDPAYGAIEENRDQQGFTSKEAEGRCW